MGELTEHAARTLRLLREVFGVKFKLVAERPEEGPDGAAGPITTMCSCLGIGYRNLARAQT
jgi:hypothetical protein